MNEEQSKRKAQACCCSRIFSQDRATKVQNCVALSNLEAHHWTAVTVTRNTTLNFGVTHSPPTNAEENLASAVRGMHLDPPQDTCQIHRNNKPVRLSGRQAAPPIRDSWDLPILECGWRKLKQRAAFTGGTDMAALSKEQQANGNETQTHQTVERCCSFQPGP